MKHLRWTYMEFQRLRRRCCRRGPMATATGSLASILRAASHAPLALLNFGGKLLKYVFGWPTQAFFPSTLPSRNNSSKFPFLISCPKIWPPRLWCSPSHDKTTSLLTSTHSYTKIYRHCFLGQVDRWQQQRHSESLQTLSEDCSGVPQELPLVLSEMF